MFSHVGVEVSFEGVGGDQYFAIAQVPQGVDEGGQQDALGGRVG